MSTDQPPPGVPPENDPFQKYPPPPPPQGGAGSPYDQSGGLPPYGGGGPYDGGAGGYGGGTGGYGGADPLAGMPPLASLGKRFLARFIDMLIVGIPMGLLGIPFGTYKEITKTTDDLGDTFTKVTSGQSMLWSLITIAVYLAYDTYLTKKNGQTVGKRVMGLRVAMLNDGSTPQTNVALMRAAVLLVPALVCCYCLWWLVNLVMIAVDKPYKQGLHDKAAKTVVVTAA
ncbi:RDD family protein [Streptomyces sp. NBC_00237]|uniref:RDD family protein n=1 Tax=Streptomyces sp. NBC_00237 TaxID=2975687 RepID=UPI002257424E|nr:RDD family protein [Streptomyces sp. NBC_00237]MCX5200917.1 RDD family protein [Streptomyces sp. NBC_00237]